ncbi:MAG TPA: hypothetical protein VE198_17935 [Actinoallomurus sp.]|nr:hypothetical protein [Actinoallomurus sp.]
MPRGVRRRLSGVHLLGYGDRTGPGSATLIGAGITGYTLTSPRCAAVRHRGRDAAGRWRQRWT